jgi:hypothetical protein
MTGLASTALTMLSTVLCRMLCHLRVRERGKKEGGEGGEGGGGLTCSGGTAARTRRQCCGRRKLSALLHAAVVACDPKPLQRGGGPCPKVAVLLLVV